MPARVATVENVSTAIQHLRQLSLPITPVEVANYLDISPRSITRYDDVMSLFDADADGEVEEGADEETVVFPVGTHVWVDDPDLGKYEGDIVAAHTSHNATFYMIDDPNNGVSLATSLWVRDTPPPPPTPPAVGTWVVRKMGNAYPICVEAYHEDDGLFYVIYTNRYGELALHPKHIFDGGWLLAADVKTDADGHLPIYWSHGATPIPV